jgi:pSer/pThr/pTyr-binding forkhead associated (FHA) protein/Mg-chelatase subunit ChlD
MLMKIIRRTPSRYAMDADPSCCGTARGLKINDGVALVRSEDARALLNQRFLALLIPLLCLVFALCHATAQSAEVRGIEVRNIKVAPSNNLDGYVSFRTATDQPTIELSQEKLSVKIDDSPIPKNDIKIKSFGDSDQGLAVLIALDISGSMTNSLPTLKRELKNYIRKLRSGKDFVAIGIIGDNWKLALDFTSDIEQASAFIDKLQGTSQTTALFESIYDGVRLLAQRGSDLPLRRSMIVLSDGMNEKTGRTAAQCVEIAKQNFIDVHSLIFLPSQNARVLAAKGEMEVISKDTGGITFTALSAEQIGDGVNKLNMEMANEIVLSIPLRHVPTNSLSHTLGINYDNVSKKVPFVVSENELTRIKSLTSEKAGGIPEKLWIYLAIGGALSAVLALLFWRRAVKQKELESAAQNEVALASPPELAGKTSIEIPPESVPDSRAEKRIDIEKPASISRPAPRKTEYRVPSSDRSITRLVLIGGAPKTQTYQLAGSQISIGAHDNNDIWIDIPSVSGRHAVLMQTANGYTITDLNSTNGTFVNGARIGQTPVTLVGGQEVRLGLVVFRAE